MRAKQLLTIAVVSTLLIGGVAALGAASPATQASDNATDAYDDRPEAADGAPTNTDRAADERAGNADSVGPNDGLPEQVPDHVSEIHDRIDAFLNGTIANLGESLSELLGGGEPADDAAENGAEEPDSDDVNIDDGDDTDTDA